LLVLFGANGRTGRTVLAAALRAGLPVRPVVRDDRDDRFIGNLIDVQDICYADSDHPGSIPPVLENATAVISCLDPRTAGREAPRYGQHAAANIVRAAVDADIQTIIHLSVVGAYRWSPSHLGRASFRSDREVRILQGQPWTMIRVSCYHDELIDGHVRPPDGRRPHPIRRSARYAPISRDELGRMVVEVLPHAVRGRTYYVGGPEVLRGAALKELLVPYVEAGSGLRRTAAPPLPRGDVAVTPDSTRVNFRLAPRERLIDRLRAPAAPTSPERVVPARGAHHPSDRQADAVLLRALGADLRWIVHDQLLTDLARMGLPTASVSLDFRNAAPLRPERIAQTHGGRMVGMRSVRAMAPNDDLLHQGDVEFLYDPLAEVFYCWWARGELPEPIWASLDMGVRRRLVADPHFRADRRVQSFRSGHERAG